MGSRVNSAGLFKGHAVMSLSAVRAAQLEASWEAYGDAS